MSKKCEVTICVKGYPRLYLAFIGMLIVGISFLCASAGGIYSFTSISTSFFNFFRKRILEEIIEEVIILIDYYLKLY